MTAPSSISDGPDMTVIDEVGTRTTDKLHQPHPKDVIKGIGHASQELLSASLIKPENMISGGQFPHSTPKRSPSHIQLTFTTPNWGMGLTSTRKTTSNTNSLTQYKAISSSRKSQGFSSSFALSPSPTSFSFSANLGSADDPIEVDNDHDDDDFNMFSCINPKQEEEISELYMEFPDDCSELQEIQRIRDYEEAIIDLSNETTGVDIEPLARKRNRRQYSVVNKEVIELDSWDDPQTIIPKSAISRGVEIVCLEDVYSEDPKLRARKDVSKSTSMQVSKAVKLERRNLNIIEPLTILESLSHKNMKLRSNVTVELRDERFLRIKAIIFDTQTKAVKIRGHQLQRARHLNGLLGCKVNEVVLFLEVDLDDTREPLEQGAIEVALDEVINIREAHLTNQKFPDCRAMSIGRYRNQADAAGYGALTIRWKYTCKYASAIDRYHNVFKERILERVRPEECLHENALPDEVRRFQWRGETIRGGSFQPMIDGEEVHKLPTEEELVEEKNSVTAKRKFSSEIEEIYESGTKKLRHGEYEEVEDAWRQLSDVHIQQAGLQEKIVVDVTRFDTCPREALNTQQPSENTISGISKLIDLTNSDLSNPPPMGSILYVPSQPHPPIHRTANQAFTYGDAFCGAGGSTRGALQAGLRPKWGFDFSTHACTSWRANFPSATCYNVEAHSFVTNASHPANIAAFKVDILHLSPPCQFFSPAHTIDGVDDEQNVASLFAVEEVIKVARPRVATLEQTFGIACSRFRWYFRSLIQMFTSQDFSVRWAIVPLAQWGLPQRRNRLIIIASCPGEITPRMPLSTHSSTDDSLLPFVSASSTLLSIPPNTPDHNPYSPSLVFPPHKQRTPWDGSKILPRAMTTSGGQNYHPSGKRDLTLREYACLQGFPLDHVFRGTCVKKQIGNAVPPCVARVLFESIRQDLERADGVIEGVEMID